MSPDDQAQFAYGPEGKTPLAAIDVQPDSHPPPKTDKLEREEQRSFANWVLQQNAKGRKIPLIWHSTAHRSKATPGTPDFMVGINGQWLSLEFKRDYASKLSADQVEFKAACDAQHLPYRIVYSAQEAIKLVEEADAIC
jgi:hypothetical protein